MKEMILLKYLKIQLDTDVERLNVEEMRKVLTF